MCDSGMIECDLTIIGTGMAGMAAALFAAGRDLSTVQVGSTGEIIFASGFLDLLGVHPVRDKHIWQDPWAGIDAIVRDIPNHPYARLNREDIRAGFDEFLEFLHQAGIVYNRRLNRNIQVLTSLGTFKPTYCVPHTMWNGVPALEKKSPCLLIDIKGLKGFSARQIAATLQNKWPDLRTAGISFPDTGHMSEVYTERMAMDLELSQTREKFAQLVQPHVNNALAVGMPAILGLYKINEIISDLEKRIGVPVFEIPTMPPSVPGLRLKAAFEKELPNKGVQLFLQKKVLNVHHGANGCFVLDIGNTTTQHIVKTKGIILASGRFLGKGLHAGRKGIRETIFDLPVYQPGERKNWHREDFLDPRGHPINRAGLEIDSLFRPIDSSGRPAFQTLFAAGSILAHQDWMRMKCGAGLAISSAYASVNAFLKLNI